ncbi:MAG: dTDP-4-dehydrorhamnose reductase [Pseudomonadota bacterium]
MRVALLGSTGQVGRETLAAATARSNVKLLALSREDADLLKPGAAADVIRKLKPDAVVNAAAWTAVDRAETERDAAFRINAEAVGEIAAAARDIGARLVHLSTDYVFGGEEDAPLDETAATKPSNVYGATKLEGENRARAENPHTVVLRTSWVYSVHGANFVKTMLKLALSRPEVGVVADQIGGPTPASAIALACLSIAGKADGPGGLYHFQGAPAASWADFAEATFRAAGKAVKVNRISTRDYPTPARRPLRTVLNCSKILRDYGLGQPDWRLDLVRTVARLMERRSSED